MRDELAAIEEVGHRAFVGGMWDELGKLQLQFLVDHGLRPHHTLLDVGCGALRGGVHFIAYLGPGNYLGIDKHAALIRAGLEEELDHRVRAECAPELVVSDQFDLDRFSKRPDYVLAQSLFTHLGEDDIRTCLRRVRAFAPPGCRFYATYFESAETADNPPRSSSLERFEYPADHLLALGESEGWSARALGDWGHPMGQRMLRFDAPALPARPRPPVSAAGPVSVAIPVRDGGEIFARCLDALARQEGVDIAETIVIDSGSRDDTRETARRAGARVVEIPAADFNHGLTRNRLAELASCDTVLFTVHDAVLLRPDAVRLLAGQLDADPSLAAVSARTRPGDDADLFSLWENWLHDELVVAPRAASEGAHARGWVDNVCAAVRRAAWQQIGFRELDFGEDADFGWRAEAAGWRTAYAPEKLVAHHHDRDAAYAMGRGAVDRLMVGDLLGGKVSLNRAVEPAALRAGCRALLREVATAVEWAIAGEERVSLRAFVERLALSIRAGVPMSDPTGELALADALLGDAALGHWAGTAAAREQLTELFEFPLLRTFAGRHDEPVATGAARTFAARLVAFKLGTAVGECLRRKRDPEVGEHLTRSYGARGFAGDEGGPSDSAPRRGAEAAAYAVLGMHRSGTSVHAAVLDLLGVPFGDERTMLPPQPDNPRGYWEQRPILDLNDELLEVLGSSWTDPTGLPEGWESAADLEPLEERARRIVDDLYGDLEVWGFKDPRLSLLLPFWLRAVPDIRCVVCVRNPLDVMRSLEARQGDMNGAAPDLWLQHTAAALRVTAGRPRLIVAYENLVERPATEVDRLAAFAGRDPADIEPGVRESIGSLVEDSLWRHRSTVADVLAHPAIPAEAKALYLWLEQETGRSGGETIGRYMAMPALVDGLAAGMAGTRTALAGTRTALDARNREARDLGERVRELEHLLELRTRDLGERGRELELHDRWLHDIQSSASWRLTAPLRRAKRLAVERMRKRS